MKTIPVTKIFKKRLMAVEPLKALITNKSFTLRKDEHSKCAFSLLSW